jgi:hypothetical protein
MPSFGFNKADFISLGKGVVITLLGALLTYLSSFIAGHDFGTWTPIIMTIWALVVNTVRKSIDGPVEQKTGITI